MMRFLRGVFLATVVSTSALAAEPFSASDFSPMVKFSVDGPAHDPAFLSKMANILVKYGATEDDAYATIKTLLPFDPADMSNLVLASGLLSAMDRTSTRTASRRVAKAFSGDVDGVRALDDELNFLTADQYTEMKKLEDAGAIQGAKRLALGLLVKRLETAFE
jgi:ABC-type oligopeptide transport system substrate-binding subunit